MSVLRLEGIFLHYIILHEIALKLQSLMKFRRLMPRKNFNAHSEREIFSPKLRPCSVDFLHVLLLYLILCVQISLSYTY